MGLITSSLRLQQLKSAKSDIEFKIQTITESKLGLSGQLAEVADQAAMASLDGTENAETKKLESYKLQLQAIEKQLDASLGRYNNQLKMIETEIESAQQVIDKNIQTSFSYGGGK